MSLVGFIDMMFSLFQETDSYFDGTPARVLPSSANGA